MKVVAPILTLLHSEQPKLHRVFAILSAIGLNEATLCEQRICFHSVCLHSYLIGGTHKGENMLLFGSNIFFYLHRPK